MAGDDVSDRLVKAIGVVLDVRCGGEDLRGIFERALEAKSSSASEEDRRSAARDMRGELVSWCREIQPSLKTCDTCPCSSLADALGELCDATPVDREIIGKTLGSLWNQCWRIIMRVNRMVDDGRLDPILAELQAQILYVIVTPLFCGVREALLWEAETALEGAREAGKRLKADSASYDHMERLCEVLTEATQSSKQTTPLPRNVTSYGNKRFMEHALRNINQFAWMLPTSLFDDDPECMKWDGAVRKGIFTDEDVEQFTRSRKLKAMCIDGWTRVVHGDWVAVKRYQYGLMRWALKMDPSGAASITAKLGGSAGDEGGSSIVIKEEQARDVLRNGLKYIDVLRAVSFNEVLVRGGSETWLDVLQAVMSSQRLYNLNNPLPHLPMWLDRDETEEVLHKMSAALRDFYFNAGDIDVLMETIRDNMAWYRNGIEREGGRALRSLAKALTMMIAAFTESPRTALDRTEAQETEDKISFRDEDPFANLGDGDMLTLSIRTRGAPPRMFSFDRGERGSTALVGVVGRSTRNAMERSEGDGGDLVRSESDFFIKVRKASDALCSAESGAAVDSDARMPSTWSELEAGWCTIEDQTLSRVHLILFATPAGFYLVDAGSKNGSMVVRRACGTGGSDRRVCCIQLGDARCRSLHDAVQQKFRVLGYEVEDQASRSACLQYGDVICVGSSELRVAWS